MGGELNVCGFGGGKMNAAMEAGSEKQRSNEAEKRRSNEAEEQKSDEADHQRGNEHSQKFGLVLDVERRELEMKHKLKIYAGQTFPAQLPTTDHDSYWFVTINSYPELVDPLTQHISYSTKFIEIAEPPARRSLLDTEFALVVTAHDEVPTHLLPAPPCEHCLAIEDKSVKALEALTKTQFRIDGRTYMVQRLTPNDDDIVWKPEDGSESLLVARKSLIGEQNPFLLFHKQSAYDWFRKHPKDCTEVWTIAEVHSEGGCRPLDYIYQSYSG